MSQMLTMALLLASVWHWGVRADPGQAQRGQPQRWMFATVSLAVLNRFPDVAIFLRETCETAVFLVTAP